MGLTVYVRERDDNGELHGIILHDNRNIEAPVTYQAERGAVIHGENGSRIVLVKGNRQQVGREKGQLSMLYFDRFPFFPKKIYIICLLFPELNVKH